MNIKTTMAKTPLLVRVVSLYIVVGFVMWGCTSLVLAITPTPSPAVGTRIVFAPKSPVSIRRVISGSPTRITIERLGIDMPILDGVYDDKTDQWTLTDKAVYFATITDEPNDLRGNTFLYGHNRKNVIGKMSGIVVGDIVTVKTSNDHVFKYVYTSDEIVKPNATTVLYDSPTKPRLTVMTCDGIWSQARRLMYFDLVEAK